MKAEDERSVTPRDLSPVLVQGIAFPKPPEDRSPTEAVAPESAVAAPRKRRRRAIQRRRAFREAEFEGETPTLALPVSPVRDLAGAASEEEPARGEGAAAKAEPSQSEGEGEGVDPADRSELEAGGPIRGVSVGVKEPDSDDRAEFCKEDSPIYTEESLEPVLPPDRSLVIRLRRRRKKCKRTVQRVLRKAKAKKKQEAWLAKAEDRIEQLVKKEEAPEAASSSGVPAGRPAASSKKKKRVIAAPVIDPEDF